MHKPISHCTFSYSKQLLEEGEKHPSCITCATYIVEYRKPSFCVLLVEMEKQEGQRAITFDDVMQVSVKCSPMCREEDGHLLE